MMVLVVSSCTKSSKFSFFFCSFKKLNVLGLSYKHSDSIRTSFGDLSRPTTTLSKLRQYGDNEDLKSGEKLKKETGLLFIFALHLHMMGLTSITRDFKKQSFNTGSTK